MTQQSAGVDAIASVEGHAYPILLAPDDVTWNVCAVRLEEKVEALRDFQRVRNLERRPRNGHVADQTVDRAASELNRARHQDRLARGRASFHEAEDRSVFLEIDKESR